MSEVQYIENNGKPAYAVIPVEEYNRLLAAASGESEGTEYTEIMAAIKSGKEETFPAEFVDRLLNTDSEVREWRKYRGFSQTSLAKATGLSQGAIALIEKGNRRPTVDTARKIANVLSCDIDDLF